MADALIFNDLTDPMDDGVTINRMEQVLFAIGFDDDTERESILDAGLHNFEVFHLSC
jgi:hypothetical protein